jgi:Domain of unknown function (DUF1918)
MHANRGDQIVVETAMLNALRRRGEVLEVIGEGERAHYRVRWEDGHESVYFPGPDARVQSGDAR